MAKSKSTQNQIGALNQAKAGAETYAKQLPPVCADLAKLLGEDVTAVVAINTQQEAAKASLRKLTTQLNKRLKESRVRRTKIIKMAEGTFGADGPEMQAFRSNTEGQV